MNFKRLIRPLAKFLIEAALDEKKDDGDRLKEDIEKTVISAIQNQSRPGGILYRDR